MPSVHINLDRIILYQIATYVADVEEGNEQISRKMADEDIEGLEKFFMILHMHYKLFNCIIDVPT